MTTVFLIWAIVASVVAVVFLVMFCFMVRACDEMDTKLDGWISRTTEAEKLLARWRSIRPAVPGDCSQTGDTARATARYVREHADA